jgi:hypothetical protein
MDGGGLLGSTSVCPAITLRWSETVVVVELHGSEILLAGPKRATLNPVEQVIGVLLRRLVAQLYAGMSMRSAKYGCP